MVSIKLCARKTREYNRFFKFYFLILSSSFCEFGAISCNDKFPDLFAYFCFYYKVLNIIVLLFFMRSLVFSDIVVACELIVKNVLILNFC